jgi:thiol:disulfide interchange protein DsbC
MLVNTWKQSMAKTGQYAALSLAMIILSITVVVAVVSAAAEAETDTRTAEVMKAFKRDFPDVQFTTIKVSGIDGVYEVTMGVNISYYAPASGKVIFGDLFDKTGENITAGRRHQLLAAQEAETAKLIDTLPLDNAIKLGSGKNIVIEFIDLDCPYCRKAEEFFKKRNDITRYVYLFPLEQIHPKSSAKSREVLCSKDRARAFAEAMDGKLDNAELKGCGNRDKEIETLLMQHKTIAEKMGVNGTPVMWVNKKYVSGADTGKIELNLASGDTGTAIRR